MPNSAVVVTKLATWQAVDSAAAVGRTIAEMIATKRSQPALESELFLDQRKRAPAQRAGAMMAMRIEVNMLVINLVCEIQCLCC